MLAIEKGAQIIKERLMLIVVTIVVLTASPTLAASLSEKVKSGEPIKIGYSVDPPYALTAPDGTPSGSMNVMAMRVLEGMGAKIDSVVTEWGGLIPGLQAGRFDVITAGMYITPKRCKNVLFSEPVGRFGDALLVLAGNPSTVKTLEQLKDDTSLKLVTVSGYAFITVAEKAGVSESDMLLVQDVPAMLQALKAGRAQVGGLSKGAAKEIVTKTGDFEIVETYQQDPATLQFSGFGFRPEDSEFVTAFNKQLASYLGSDEMLKDVAEFNYDADLIGNTLTTVDICAR